ncbi:MAG: DUF4430 domain-containing protein [Thermoleophilaceae bacterium]|nr:DUF4430 domain-containing protein [Thermoleophilaceae bacterium]
MHVMASSKKHQARKCGRRKRTATALAVAALAAVSLTLFGCGSAATTGQPAVLAVTHDFGTVSVGSVEFEELPKGPTVMRLLQRSFPVETSYGGRFVQSIKGVASQTGPARDWFFYVNGLQAEVGAADVRVAPGDYVQWDYHRWDVDAQAAIVGAFPQPFKGSGARVECMHEGDENCAAAGTALRKNGVALGSRAGSQPTVIVVGSASDERTRKALGITNGGAVIAATLVKGKAVWLVVGTDDVATRAGVNALTPAALRNRFAVRVARDGQASAATPISPRLLSNVASTVMDQR